MIEQPGWNWGPAWNKLCSDVATLAWLFEEERVIQRLYVESMFWALTGKRFPIDEFANEVGIGVATDVTSDDPQQSAESALDAGSESEG